MSVSVGVNYNDERRREMTSSIAMVFTLISFAMLFATLMLGYFAYRFTADMWPPVGMQRIDLTLPTISTVILLFSSLTYFAFEERVGSQDWSKARGWYLLSVVLGLAFMGAQFVLWHGLKQTGIYVDTTVFASIIYAFTWVHATHVVGGLLALLFLIPLVGGKKEFFKCKLWVKNVGQFWHFLGLVWVMMYFSLFVF